jgi:hypothetical protein
MTIAPFLAPVLPSGTSPARPTPGAAPTDLAGLFALLVAGLPPAPAVAQDAGPSTPAAPALAPALLAGGAPRVPTTPSGAQPTTPAPDAAGSAPAATLAAASSAPPATPAPVQAGLESGPQPTFAPQDRVRVANVRGQRERGAGAVRIVGGERSRRAPVLATDTPSTTARPEVVAMALATDAKAPSAPNGSSPQAGAPANLADPPPGGRSRARLRAHRAFGRFHARLEPGLIARRRLIGVHIARAVPARIDRLFVQLEPAALGRVEVRLKFHRDDQVSAVIAAERPDTLDALQRDARLLERSLHQAGLRLDSDGLTFSLKREQAHHQPHEDGWLASANGIADQPLPAAHDQAPPLHWFQSLRALDIRV